MNRIARKVSRSTRNAVTVPARMRKFRHSDRKFARVLMTIAGAAILSIAPIRSPAQQAADNATLSLPPATLPKASPKHPYRYEFQAQGGTGSLRFMVAKGILPAGMRLAPDGILSGRPAVLGDYKITLNVRDASQPPQTASREFVLHVVAPLLMKWRKYVQINGSRADGTVTVSNSTEDDFDFTLIVLAVNEYGRATAIGYQHFSLKSGTDEQEIPFGETLPKGAYMVHVDGVAEVAAKDKIYRARLQSKEKLEVAVGP